MHIYMHICISIYMGQWLGMFSAWSDCRQRCICMSKYIHMYVQAYIHISTHAWIKCWACSLAVVSAEMYLHV